MAKLIEQFGRRSLIMRVTEGTLTVEQDTSWRGSLSDTTIGPTAGRYLLIGLGCDSVGTTSGTNIQQSGGVAAGIVQSTYGTVKYRASGTGIFIVSRL